MSSKTSVYLIRHGIAAEKSAYVNDEERPLVEKGRQQTQKVAKKLRSLNLKFDLILTSPLVRAKQTAEILTKAGLSKEAMEFPDLAPMGSFSNWVNWMVNCQTHSSGGIALVGHQPDLGNWAEMLIWGTVKGNIDFKKSGIIGIHLPPKPDLVGNCTLFWLTSPKYL